MKRILSCLAAMLLPFVLASCVSFAKAYAVPVEEPLEEIVSRGQKIINEGTYIKAFNAVDKMDKKHIVVFLDTKYLSIDGVVFAYKFSNIMYYGPGLSLRGRDAYKLPDKIWGFQGYATAAADSNTTVSFIFAKKLFGQKGYSSMYEANEINGVWFGGKPADGGYIDDFGKWRDYTYFDYFENVFGSRKQLSKTQMYMALQYIK